MGRKPQSPSWNSLLGIVFGSCHSINASDGVQGFPGVLKEKSGAKCPQSLQGLTMNKAFITGQLDLLENKLGKPAGVALRDPAFADNKRLPIHRWAPWIAGYSAAFIDDVMDVYLPQDPDVLKPGGIGVIVVGNSIVQGIEFKVDQFFAELGESAGLTVEAVHPIRRKRVGAGITKSSVRRGGQNGASLYEAAVVLRKSRHSHPLVTLSTDSATMIRAKADTTSSVPPGMRYAPAGPGP
jgi:hypothetical protein